jgi:hypothetical protein
VSRVPTRFSRSDVLFSHIFECFERLDIMTVTCVKENFVVCNLIACLHLSLSIGFGLNLTISITLLKSPLKLQWE